MKSKEYKIIKNYIHNDLKLSKEELKSIIVEAVKDQAKSQVKTYMQQDPNLNTTIKDQVFKEISNAITGRSYDRSRDEFFKNIGTEIVKQLNINLK